jgi:hypothetical protein
VVAGTFWVMSAPLLPCCFATMSRSAATHPRALPLSTRFWNEPPRNQKGPHLRDPCRSKFIRNEIQPRQELGYSFPQV